MKKYVLFYESADDVLTKGPLHLSAHRAHWDAYRTNGTLLLIGPFSNPLGGALAVFTSREAAAAFAQSDPFVLNGVVRGWYIREWNEALAEP